MRPDLFQDLSGEAVGGLRPWHSVRKTISFFLHNKRVVRDQLCDRGAEFQMSALNEGGEQVEVTEGGILSSLASWRYSI